MPGWAGLGGGCCEGAGGCGSGWGCGSGGGKGSSSGRRTGSGFFLISSLGGAGVYLEFLGSGLAASLGWGLLGSAFGLAWSLSWEVGRSVLRGRGSLAFLVLASEAFGSFLGEPAGLLVLGSAGLSWAGTALGELAGSEGLVLSTAGSGRSGVPGLPEGSGLAGLGWPSFGLSGLREGGLEESAFFGLSGAGGAGFGAEGSLG